MQISMNNLIRSIRTIILESQKDDTNVQTDAEWNWYKQEARHDLENYGPREGNDRFHEWAEDNQLSIYDAERVWEDVLEEYELENESAPSVPEWETQEWHDGMTQDWQDDSIEELEYAIGTFQDGDPESRAIVKFLKDMIRSKKFLRESVMIDDDPMNKIIEHIRNMYDNGQRAFAVWQAISKIDRVVAQEVHPKARAADGTPLFKLWKQGRIEEYIDDITERLASHVDPETLRLVANSI